MKNDPDSWFYNYKDEVYYLFESRDNTIINSLEKIKNIAEYVSIDVLVNLLSNSLKKRTAPKKRSYPPEAVIKQYILSSKHTEIKDNTVYLKVEEGNLTSIEGDIQNYLSKVDVNDYPTISKHLISLGYDKPNVDKTVFHSPLVFVDKSEGRSHYKFNLVGSSEISPERASLYEDCRQKLIKASIDGSDGSSTVSIRKEHYLLSLWLFEGKKQKGVRSAIKSTL